MDQYYPELLEEKLTAALQAYLPERKADAIDPLTDERYLLDILCLYLLHGRLLWHIHLTYPTISRLFLAVLQVAAAGLKTFLLTYGHYTGLQQRLVIHLDDPALESGIRLLAPHESTFICSYIHLLQEKYKTERPEISQEKYRDITWQLIYQYLLTNRSSYFNKKSFIHTTLIHLAKEYNTDYRALVILLTNDLTRLDTIRSTPTELFMILNELRQDIELQHYADRLAGKVEWKDKNEIIHLVKERKKLPLSYLVKLLAGKKNAHFRQQLCETLAETDHHFLIRLLEPANSRFIIAYASGLDKQKQAGILQGKAGSNYQALKWNFIYDVLLLARDQVFNKKQFVQRTLDRIAAHYNVDIHSLITYFHEELLLADKSLPFDVVQAIRQLYAECIINKQVVNIHAVATPHNTTGNSPSEANRAREILKKIYSRQFHL
ncbi:MAG: hypothetical protein LUD74_04930 [Tannerellaceae bacterium]|nr:hypothetical protein [Tannerellaceae bacterium]